MGETERDILADTCDRILHPRTYWLLAASVGLVKIGKSHDPVNRMLALRTMNAARVTPLLVHKVPEAELHEKFKDLRDHGEWFCIDSVMVQYLRDILEHDAADQLEQVKYNGRPT